MQTMDRMNELKTKGWKNLSADERKEFQTLKKNNVQSVTMTETVAEAKVMIDTTPVITATEIFTPYTFLQNTKFQGQYFSKGDRVPDCSQETITNLLINNLIKL